MNQEEQPCWADPSATSTVAAASTMATAAFEAEELQGNIGDAGGDGNFLTQPYSTLDEPVRETIMRDVRSVASKIQVVLLPLDKTNPLDYVSVSTEEQVEQDENQRKVLQALRDWDLWGPLVVCLALSILLSIRSPTEQASGVFAAVFCSMWLGSAIVTINAKLLGGTISFFQSVCVLGYSVFPFVLSALLIAILSKTFLGYVWIDIVWVMLGYVWSVRASTVFIGQYIKKERRLLAVMPVFFYYVLLGWLVLLF